VKNFRIVGSIAIAILVSFFLFSCNDEPSMFSQEDWDSDDVIANIGIESFRGGFVITWDQLADATEYEVWRRTLNGARFSNMESRLLARISAATVSTLQTTGTVTVGNGLFYIDRASTTNQLRNDVEYEYRIFARGPNVSARVTVTADNIPAQGTALAAPANARLNLIEGAWGAGPSYQLVWDNVPGVTYSIAASAISNPDEEGGFVLDGSTIQGNISSTFISVNELARQRFASIPFTGTNGGTKRVEIRASVADNYYLPSETVVVELPDAPVTTVLSVVNNLTVLAETGNINQGVDNSGNQVNVGVNANPVAVIEWNRNRNTVASFNLWRAERLGNVITGDWVAVTASQVTFNNLSAVERVQVRDTAVEIGKQYAYLLIVNGLIEGQMNTSLNLTADFQPTLLTAAESFRTSMAPTLNFSAIQNAEFQALGLRVFWDDDSTRVGTATYNLFRSPITTDASGNQLPYNWTQVVELNMANATHVNQNTESNPGVNTTIVFFRDDYGTLPTRVQYAYRLTETRTINGATVTNRPRIVASTMHPFMPSTNITFNVSPGTTTGTETNVNFSLSIGGSLANTTSADYIRIHDFTAANNAGIEVWRRNATGAQAQFERVGTWNFRTLNLNTSEPSSASNYNFRRSGDSTPTWTNISTVPTPATGNSVTWEYKIVVRFGDRELENLGVNVRTVTISN
jgi:hypothetical protein